MDTSSSYAKEFIRVLRIHSVDKSEPIREWKVVYGGIDDKVDSGRCICTKDITRQYHIQNKHTGKTLTVGCECIKRFRIEHKLQCRICAKDMTGVYRRMRDGDRTCNTCKREARHTVRDLKNNYFRGRTFEECLTDEKASEALLNDSLPGGALFEEYVTALEILGMAEIVYVVAH